MPLLSVIHCTVASWHRGIVYCSHCLSLLTISVGYIYRPADYRSIGGGGVFLFLFSAGALQLEHTKQPGLGQPWDAVMVGLISAVVIIL